MTLDPHLAHYRSALSNLHAALAFLPADDYHVDAVKARDYIVKAQKLLADLVHGLKQTQLLMNKEVVE